METVRYVMKNIVRRKIRSVLTILSIAIGVVSITLIGAIGETGKRTILEEMSGLGIDGLSVTADTRLKLTELTAKELGVVRKLSVTESAVPVMMEIGRIGARGLVAESVIWGVDEGAEQVIVLEALYGRLIERKDVSEKRRVCVVDESVARTFYSRDNITGRKINVMVGNKSEELEVIGVVSSGGNILQGVISEYLPGFIYIPYTTAQELCERNSLDQIAVKISSDYDIDESGEMIISALEKSSNVKRGYRVSNIAAHKENLTKIMDIVVVALSLVAGISLVVAGLGTMTIMISMVKERTKEIGIKKSIGAKSVKIMWEFLLESMLISFLGSVLGVGIGVILIAIFGAISQIPITVNVGIIILGILLSVLEGGIFGAYPAYKASRLEAVDALRR